MSLMAATNPYEAAWQAWNYGGGRSRGEPAPNPKDYQTGPAEAPEAHPGAGGTSWWLDNNILGTQPHTTSGQTGWYGPPDPPYPGAAVPQVQVWHAGPPPPNYTGPTGPRPATTYQSPVGAPTGGATPQASGDPRAYFNSLFPGTSLSSDQLWAQRDALARQGITVMTNGEGVHGKIKLPDGSIVDVIQGAGSGQNLKAWQTGGGSSATGGGGATGPGGVPTLPPGYSTGQFTGGGQYPLSPYSGPGIMAPWTTPFKSPGDFHAPSTSDMQADDGYKFRLQQGAQTIERAASARGNLVSGGTLKDLTSFAQGEASNEYDRVYGRRMGENELAYGRGMGEYNLAHGIYNDNRNTAFNYLSGLMNTGAQAASAGAGVSSGYGQNAGNTMEGIGNAQGAAAAAGGAAYGGAASNTGNTIAQLYLMRQMYPGRF